MRVGCSCVACVICDLVVYEKFSDFGKRERESLELGNLVILAESERECLKNH